MCSVPRIYEKIHQRLLHELAESSEEKRHQTAWALETGWRRFAEANHLPIELSPRAQLDETVWPQLDVEIASEVREIFGGRLRATFAAAQASTTPSHASSARSASTSCSSMASPKPRPSSPSPA